jgi:hypothetical protein
MILKRLFGRQTWDEIAVILFVSTGRTGTNFLYKFYHELGLNLISEHEARPDISNLGPSYAKGAFTKEQILREVLKMRSKQLEVLKARGIPIYLESNGAYSFIFHLLKEIFKNLTVVHIIREPYSWITSAFNRPGVNSEGQLVPRYSIDSRWKLTSDDIEGQSDIINWQSSTLAQKLAWTWYYKNTAILNNSKYVDKFLTIRFEDLFGADAINQFKQLNVFLKNSAGVDLKDGDHSQFFSRRENSTTNIFIENQEDWDSGEQSVIDKIIRPVQSIFYPTK